VLSWSFIVDVYFSLGALRSVDVGSIAYASELHAAPCSGSKWVGRVNVHTHTVFFFGSTYQRWDGEGGDWRPVLANRDSGRRNLSNCSVHSPNWLEPGIRPSSTGVGLFKIKHRPTYLHIYTNAHGHSPILLT
jgi:hypothetical protein